MSDVTLASLPIQGGEMPASVASGGSVGANDNGLVWNGSAWTSAKMALAEPVSTPYTVFVDQSNGSDSNKGNSAGNAFQTLTKAIQQLQQVGNHPGVIELIVVGGSDFPMTQSIVVTKPTIIKARGTSTATITRSFGTPNGRSVWDAVTTAGGSSVSSATAVFTNADNGRIVAIYGAGVGGGTFYDFINGNPPSGTVANLTATTTIARNSTTDPHGVKMSVVGDWSRVVTDAAMTSGQSVVTSATAAWTAADAGTELIIAGAGQGGQALRGAIISVSGNTATITAVASNTVTNKRCAIGVNLGNLVCLHAGTLDLRGVIVQDTSSGQNRIGSQLEIVQDDQGAGGSTTVADITLEDMRFTSSDTAGAFEHAITEDGSWGQASGGGGVRRVALRNVKIFGTRAVAETIRLINPVHWGWTGGGIVGAAPTSPNIQQGIVILDPQNNGGGRGGPDAQDLNFVGIEGDGAIFYCEGWNVNVLADRFEMITATGTTGRRTIELGATSAYCQIIAPNKTTVGGSITAAMADEWDAGSNNVIQSQLLKRVNSKAIEARMPTQLAFETFPRGAGMTNNGIAGSGQLVAQSIWLPGGKSLTKLALLGGVTALAWGTGWTGQHFIYGLYDPDGNLIAQSADQGGTAAFSSTFSLTAGTIAKDGAGSTISSVRVPRSGLCSLALLVNSGTGGSGFTYPTFRGIVNNMASIAPVLCGVAAGPFTALPTTLPALTGQTIEVYGGAA